MFLCSPLDRGSWVHCTNRHPQKVATLHSVTFKDSLDEMSMLGVHSLRHLQWTLELQQALSLRRFTPPVF